MLHVTHHFDAGDIDKVDQSPFKKLVNVYHAKRRFPSMHQNMHYNKNHEAVGTIIGDRELESMRFRTTQMDTHNHDKIKFGRRANPPTVFENMAKASRFRLSKDGKPRSLLAHEDYRKGSGRRDNTNQSLMVTPR